MSLIEKALRAKAAVEAAADVLREPSGAESPRERDRTLGKKVGSERPEWPKAQWAVVTVRGLPEGLPFASGHDYLQCYCADPSIKGGEARTIYADRNAIEALKRVIAAAEDRQALVARDSGLPRLATYFDTLWAIDPHEWFKGDETDVDNNHAAWLVVKPLTPTGRIPKYPYEVTFNAQDYGQVNYSLGTVSYRPDGSPGKLRMIYWRAGSVYEVRFETAGSGDLEPVKIMRDDGTGKQLVWGK